MMNNGQERTISIGARIMQKLYESDFCDVSYLETKNLVFVEWKKYCELDEYRKPLLAALQVIKDHRCDYVADTRNGFEDNPEDTKWVADYFMPTVLQTNFFSSLVLLSPFIIDEANSLKDELEGQANDSADVIDFRYIFSMDEIG